MLEELIFFCHILKHAFTLGFFPPWDWICKGTTNKDVKKLNTMQVFKKFIKANPREIFLQIFSNLNSRYLVIERLQIVWGSTNMTFGSTIPLFDTAGIYSHACPIRLKKKMWQYYCLIGGERREREKKVKLWQWNCQNWKRWEKKRICILQSYCWKRKKKF